MKISEVMTACPYQLDADASIDEAMRKMALHKVRHLPIVDKGTLLGVVSERDCRLSKFVCDSNGFCPKIGELCTTEPHVVKEDDDVAAVALGMANGRHEYALVADGQDELVGIFTTTDACRLIHFTLQGK